MKEMRSFCTINKRNLGLYFKDHAAVFFSLLSMLITIAIMVFFLGDLSKNAVLDTISMIPGRGGAEDVTTSGKIVFYWISAGILTINAATVTHAFYANMIKDRTGSTLNSLFVMPIRRPVFVMGYVSGAWIAGCIMSLVTLIVVEAIGYAKGYGIPGAAVQVKIVLLIALINFVFAAVLFLFASMVKSSSAWSGIGIVLGTLAGFLGGIYFPLGQMSETLAKIVKCFPFIYGTSVFRKVILADVEDGFFGEAPEMMRTEFDKAMGMDFTLFKNELSVGGKIGILVAVGLIFSVLATLYLTYSKKKDR